MPVVKTRVLTVLLLVALALLATGCSAGSSSAEKPAAVDTQLGPDEPNAVISWSEASSRVGQVITVEGPIVATRHRAGKTLLIMGFGAADPGRFVVVIPNSLKKAFPEPPAAFFADRLVRVQGRIVDDGGVPSITVTSAKKIRAE